MRLRHFVVFSLLAAPALGDSFLNNGGFDTDTAGWTGAGVAWSPVDERGNAGSGSAYFEIPPHTSTALLSGCFPVNPFQPIVFGASASFEGADPYAVRVAAKMRFYPAAGCAGDNSSTSYPALIAESAYPGWSPTQANAVAPAGAASARLELLLAVDTDTPQPLRVDNAFAVDGTCEARDTVMCLESGRFRTTARYFVPDGSRGVAGVRQLSEDSGYLWFFSVANLELVVKVLDGCGYNDRFWVYAAGLTNLGVQLRIVDTLTGASWSFDNPTGDPFPPRQDIEAFATCE